jgi:hypothetical protein
MKHQPAQGQSPADPLHLVYGPAAILCLPVAVVIGARASADRPSRPRRDAWTAGGGIVLVGGRPGPTGWPAFVGGLEHVPVLSY